MIDLLVRKWVKNSEQTGDPAVRRSYGVLSGAVGIVCNCLLFALKLAAGLLSNSIAILSDAFNNLADCAGCVVTLWGSRLSAKPADQKHPFGHGRIEYLAGMAIGVLILLMGLELAISSVRKLLDPEPVHFHWLTVCILLLSIAVKLWMARLNTRLGGRIQSLVLLAEAKDSRSDVIATAATLAAVLASLVTDAPVDGVMGILVSLFILRSGVDILRDTAGALLGRPADPETARQVRELVLAHPMVEGMHDLVLHDYGPGRTLGSCHVELNSGVDFRAAHETADQIERELLERLHISMTIHMDPAEPEDERVRQYRDMTQAVLREIDDGLTLHDFQLTEEPDGLRLSFDLLIPYGSDWQEGELEREIGERLRRRAPECRAAITFDWGTQT